MPFLSKDWRGPGEEWVRYEGGWEMRKCFLHNDDAISTDDDEEKRHGRSVAMRSRILRKRGLDDEQRPPFYPITLKCTKEIAGFNELSEALLRLDFPEAVKDVRRFNYVSKLTHLLLRHDRLSTLSGAAQRILFRLLEIMADVVYETDSNQHVLRALLDDLHSTVAIYHVWGSHLGSTMLFKRHVEKRRKISEFLDKMQVKYKQDLAVYNARPELLQKLPEECIREILLRLCDHRDLERASKTCPTMEAIILEKRIWRELVQTHFTKQQIDFVLNKNKNENMNKIDWKSLYERLRRNFVPRESFAELIMLCRNCRSLFWQSRGHPCPVMTQTQPDHVPVTPLTFLTFFSV